MDVSEDLEEVTALLKEVVEGMAADPRWSDLILGDPVVAGVESMAGGVVTIRIIAKCAPNENFTVSREIRGRVKAALDEAGIRAPAAGAPYGGEQGGTRP